MDVGLECLGYAKACYDQKKGKEGKVHHFGTDLVVILVVILILILILIWF